VDEQTLFHTQDIGLRQERQTRHSHVEGIQSQTHFLKTLFNVFVVKNIFFNFRLAKGEKGPRDFKVFCFGGEDFVRVPEMDSGLQFVVLLFIFKMLKKEFLDFFFIVFYYFMKVFHFLL
jgi:hypothetical protein